MLPAVMAAFRTLSGVSAAVANSIAANGG